MLSVKHYSQEYIDNCRSKIKSDVFHYKTLVETATSKTNAGKELSAAVKAFQHRFFNNMVLVLEGLFVHRMRGKEGKDGNPLNEVRILCNSIMNNNGILNEDKTTRLKPEESVLKYEFGDEIKVNEAEFSRIAEAFFTEIENKYLE